MKTKRTGMRRWSPAAIALVGIVSAGVLAASLRTSKAEDKTLVKRGEYLVTITG